MMQRIRNKVMVIDDDALVLQTVVVALEARGYAVIARSNPIGTGAAIAEERPETAILDVEMPGLRGDSLLRLLERKPSFPMPWVILHSSLPLLELEQLMKETRAAGVIRKADMRSFLSAFEALLTKLRRGGPTA